MATKQSILASSKRCECRIQKALWPGTNRPWESRWDLEGPGVGGLWYGEVKESRQITLTPAMKLLRKAAAQLAEAVTEADGETMGGLFVVLHQVGSPEDWVWLLEGTDLRGPFSLEEFKARWCAAKAEEL